MAKFNKRGVVATPVASMLSAAELMLAKNDSTLRNEELVGNIIGTESFQGEIAAANRQTVASTIEQQLERNLQDAGIDAGNLTNAQREAAAIVSMARGNPMAYAQAAMATDFPALESGSYDAPMLTSGAYGSQDTEANVLGLEYFNEQSLDKHMAASLVFNVQAARQGEFAETFFPTITIDPTEAGLLIEVQKTMIHRGVRHALHDKDSQAYNRRNILDAATDFTVLEDRSIDFVPYMIEDGSRDDWFVPATLKTPRSVILGNYSVRTNPLKVIPGKKQLLRLSAHPGLVTSGVLDESDEFEGRVALDTVYFLVKKAGETDDKGKLVSFKTQNMARASFNKTQEGDGREMSLEFRGASFGLHAQTTDVGANAVPALQDVVAGEYRVQFTVNVAANINLQTGVESLMASGIDFLAVTDKDGVALDPTAGAVKTMLDAIDIKFYGYDYKMTRSNANRRSKGLLVDNVTERERYKIVLGSPITSRKPIGRTDSSQALNDLITAARLRNDNLAITKLLNYTETLADVYAGMVDPYQIVSIEGAGRHYIAPWYEAAVFDVRSRIAALQSTDVSDAIREALLIQLRDQVTRAYQQSRFQPALEMLSGYTQSRPKVIIGTDVVTANWLWEKGDLRTLGDAFEYKIVTTNDKRFYGRIQWAFQVGDGGYSPLNFGNMLWVPELVSDTNLTRNDGVANELTVQPRNYHVVNCPVTGVIAVTGLHDYLKGKPSIGVQLAQNLGALITDAVMDGLTGTGTGTGTGTTTP